MKPKPMLVAGIMSGTSADGIDVALCRISPTRTPEGALLRTKAGVGSFPTIPSARRAYRFDTRPHVELLRHRAFPYSTRLREAVLGSMDARNISAAELARLNWRLGEAYADAVQSAAQGYALDLVGCHGQTIYHQGIAQPYAGRSFSCTWQFGEPALIAARCTRLSSPTSAPPTWLPEVRALH
jgi:anhydro-N-acetylmuramic acid kinase